MKKIYEKLDDRRANLLFTICERDDIFALEVIYQIVQEIRSITKIMKMIKNENLDKDKKQK